MNKFILLLLLAVIMLPCAVTNATEFELQDMNNVDLSDGLKRAFDPLKLLVLDSKPLEKIFKQYGEVDKAPNPLPKQKYTLVVVNEGKVPVEVFVGYKYDHLPSSVDMLDMTAFTEPSPPLLPYESFTVTPEQKFVKKEHLQFKNDESFFQYKNEVVLRMNTELESKWFGWKTQYKPGGNATLYLYKEPTE